MKINLYIVYCKQTKSGTKYLNPVYLMGDWKHGKGYKVEPYAIFNTRIEAQQVKKMSGKEGKIKVATLEFDED